MTRLLPVLAVLALLVAGGGYFLTQSSDEMIAAPAAAETATVTADSTVSELAPDMALGSPDAPITLIEYASFTCPHCANFHEDVVDRLKADYVDTGKVRFAHREVYFDRYGLWAGLIARCGGEMRYFGLVDILYDTQQDWIGSGDGDEVLDNLRKIGRTAGMNDDELDACLQDEAKAGAMVAAYKTNAEADDIKGTPTMVINGEKHSNMSYADLKVILDGLLAE